jgi:hypothetical protein
MCEQLGQGRLRSARHVGRTSASPSITDASPHRRELRVRANTCHHCNAAIFSSFGCSRISSADHERASTIRDLDSSSQNKFCARWQVPLNTAYRDPREKPKEATPVMRLIEPIVTPTSRCASVTMSSLGRFTMGTVHRPARLATVTVPPAKSSVTDKVSGVGENEPLS